MTPLSIFINLGSHWMNNLVHFLLTPGPVTEMMTVTPRLLELVPIQNVLDQVCGSLFVGFCPVFNQGLVTRVCVHLAGSQENHICYAPEGWHT